MSERKANLILTALHVTAGDLTITQSSFLINLWLLLPDGAARCRQQQIAVRGQPNTPSPLKPQPDHARVSAWREHQVILQLLLISVIDHINAGIHILAANFCIVPDVSEPPRGIFTDEI